MTQNRPIELFEEGMIFEFTPISVNSDQIIKFARKYDPAYFHTDPEAAESSMLGGLIGSGFHTCSLTMRMMCDAFLLRSPCQGSPGFDYIDWLEPVRPDDTLSGHSTVISTRFSAKHPDIQIVSFKHETFNQHGRPVLVMENSILMKISEKTQ